MSGSIGFLAVVFFIFYLAVPLRVLPGGKMQGNAYQWMGYETEDLNNAAIILENIIIKYPTKKNYWIQLAGIYQRLGNDNRALAIYELAYLKNFLKKEEIIQLCKNYLYFEMPYKAAIVLEKEMAIGKIDTSLKMLNMLVDGWILAQENEKAESVFNEIISLYNDEKSRLRLGQLYIENEEWNKAADVLNIELETEDITLISKINLLLGSIFLINLLKSPSYIDSPLCKTKTLSHIS